VALLSNVFSTKWSRAAGVVLVLVVIAAIFANFIGPQNPFTQNADLLAGPSWHHLLGTDNLGRDTLSRLILGTRYTLVGALEAVGIGVIGGVVPGVYFVFAPRWMDFAVMRFVDSMMAIPGVVFAMGFVAAFGETQAVAMLAIGILMIPHFFRITRAATLRLVEMEYVQLARSMGATRVQVIRMHIWRKILPTVAVTTASSMAAGLLAVSSLAFLGVGMQPPAPTWGGMLSQDLTYLSQVGWLVIFPGLAVVFPVAALGVLADRLRDITGGASLGLLDQRVPLAASDRSGAGAPIVGEAAA
jgi:peptide/nickel transport system permease protein